MNNYPRYFRYKNTPKIMRFDGPECGCHFTDWEGRRDEEGHTTFTLIEFTERQADLWEEISEIQANAILLG